MALKILQIKKKIAANNNDYKNANNNNRAPVLFKCVRRLLTTSFLLSSLVAIRVCFKRGNAKSNIQMYTYTKRSFRSDSFC